MKTLQLEQGSAAWQAHRDNHRNASDASAMMGCSPYVTRAELLRRVATGMTPEVSEQTQHNYDRGHAAEAKARPFVEAEIGQDLYPAVGVSDEYPHLSSSFDGLVMDESLAWECKLKNMQKVEWVQQHGAVPLPDHWQTVQQLVVSRAESLRYSLVDDEGIEVAHCTVTLDPRDEAQLLAGWAQFDADVLAYQPETPTAVVLAAPVESLPAVAVRLDGKIAVIDNLDVFGERLRAFVERIDKEPSTDQAFADCEEAVKVLKRAEDALEAAEANALAQIDPVEAMRRTVADLNNLARSTRLLIEKVVKARKESLRIHVAAEARTAYCAHLSQINATLSVPVLESASFVADVAAAIKGKRSLDNLRADVAQVVANYKIASNADADRHRTNIAIFKDANRAPLFPDFVMLVRSKLPEDLSNLVQARIAEADKAEQARLDAERAKIRAEEEARAQREAERLAEQERERIRNEEQAKAQAEQQAAWDAQRKEDAERREAMRASNDPQPSAPETPAAVAVFGEATQQPPAAAVRPGAVAQLINITEINRRLAPITLTADGLASLGIRPSETSRVAKLYPESELPAICRALGRRLREVLDATPFKEAA